MSNILLADDHPMIRTAIEALLRNTSATVVEESASVEETLAQIEHLQPDILLLDLSMPDGNGMSVVRKCRAEANPVQIVILTAAISDAQLMEARALGVRGIVLKSSDPAGLIDCFESLEQGEDWIDPELIGRIDELSADPSRAQRPSLAPRERQLIHFVRQGLRNREIASELGVTEGTVKVYLHGVFEKLGVSSRTELAVRADEFLADG